MGIFAAVLLGLFLRTWNLPHHGFAHYDEAHYMMEVKFWRDIIENAGTLAEALRAGKLNAAFLEATIDGIPPSFTPKPLHSFWMALFSLATGLREEWVGCLWSALVGTLTIALVGGWTAARCGAGTGILAALLLAVSRSHVMYSRSQLAEADAIFFALLAIFLHVHLVLKQYRGEETRTWQAVFAGVLYGIAVAVNYRCLIILPIVWLWDILLSRRSLKRPMALAAGLAAVLCMIELPYRIYIWKGGNLPGGMMTYFEGFWARMFQDLPMGPAKTVSSFVHTHPGMFDSYMYLDGSWWLLFMVLGLAGAIRSRCPERWLVGLLAWIPILLFSTVTRGDGPRAVMTSIPFFVILIAMGLADVYAWLLMRPKGQILARGGVGVVAAALLIAGGMGSWKETRVRSAWPDVGRWLAQEPRPVIMTSYPLAVRYYLRKDRAKLPSIEDTAVVTPGLWVVDRYNATYAYPYPVVRKVISTYQPERVFNGTVYPQTGLFLDWGAFARGGRWREELKRDNMGDIEIYKIQ